MTNYLKAQKIDIQQLMQTLSLDDVKAHLVEIVREVRAPDRGQAAAARAAARLRDHPAPRHRRPFPLDLPPLRGQAVPLLPAEEDQQDDD